jgi:hypothetical protein
MWTDKIDSECYNLCNSLNNIIGVKTLYACCGHGKNRFYILFSCEVLDNLKPLVEILVNNNFKGWDIILTLNTDFNQVSKVNLLLLNNRAAINCDEVYNQAEIISALLNDKLKEC